MDASAPIDRIAQVLGWSMLALLGYLVFLVVEPFLWPFGWAAVQRAVAAGRLEWARAHLAPVRAAGR